MILFEAVVHWLHIMAAIVWVGGMLFTGFVLAPLARTLSPEVRYPLVRAIGHRFSRVGWIALAVSGTTGVYKVYSAWDPELFFHSIFGAALGLKILLVLVMVTLSILHDFVWGPRLTDPDKPLDRTSDRYQETVKQLTLWARVNMALAVTVVFVGVFMRMNPF